MLVQYYPVTLVQYVGLRRSEEHLTCTPYWCARARVTRREMVPTLVLSIRRWYQIPALRLNIPTEYQSWYSSNVFVKCKPSSANVGTNLLGGTISRIRRFPNPRSKSRYQRPCNVDFFKRSYCTLIQYKGYLRWSVHGPSQFDIPIIDNRVMHWRTSS